MTEDRWFKVFPLSLLCGSSSSSSSSWKVKGPEATNSGNSEITDRLCSLQIHRVTLPEVRVGRL